MKGFILCLIAVLLFLGVLLIPPLGQTVQPVLGNENGDIRLQFYPWRCFAKDRLLQGDLPEWNPLSFCGTPFLAGAQSGLLYLPNILFLLFSVRTGLNLCVAFHLALAGVGILLYLRRVGVSPWGQVVAAVSFMASGPFLWRTYCGGLTVVCTVAWLPLCFLAMEWALDNPGRRRIALACLPFAMAATAGHPQYYFILVLGCLLHAGSFMIPRAFGKPRLALRLLSPLLVVGIGSCLAACQLLPSFLVSHETLRTTPEAMRRWGESSFPPESLFTLFNPYVFGDLFHGPYWGRWYLWETVAYSGVVALVLSGGATSILEPRRRGLFGLIFFGMFLALGHYNPLVSLAVNQIPFLAMFRGAAKFLILPAFGIACLAGIGLDRALGDNPAPAKRLAIFALGPALLCLLMFGLFSSPIAFGLIDRASQIGERFDPSPLSQDGLFAAAAVSRGSSLMGFLLTLATAACILPWPMGFWRKVGLRGRRIVLLLLCVWDMFFFGHKAVDSFNESLCFWPPEMVQHMKQAGPDWRMAAPGWMLPNQNMVQGLNAPEGYDVNLLKPVSRVLASANGKPENSPDYSVVLDRGGPLVDGLCVRFILCPLDMTFEEKGTLKIMTSGQNDLYERSSAWKRARLVHKVKVVREPQEELKALRSMSMGDTVLLDRDPPGPLEETEVSQDSVAWIKDDPDLVILKTFSPGSSLLVLADSYASGWKAIVDGTEEPILRANVGFRAVPLASGSHEVTFQYQTPGFRPGLLISGLFALSVLVCLAPWPKRAKVS